MKDYLTEIADLKEIIRLERDEVARLERELAALRRTPGRKPSNMHMGDCTGPCGGCYR